VGKAKKVMLYTKNCLFEAEFDIFVTQRLSASIFKKQDFCEKPCLFQGKAFIFEVI